MKKLIQSISLLLFTAAVLSAQPKWNPVIYTNSTTLYGKVTINGVPAQLGDKVGVFVGDECRGVADVVDNLGEGYVSILIQGEVSEEVSFRIWKQSNDVVYKVINTVITSPGGTIGTPPDYFLIDGNGPDWKPVIYTNSTTLYGLVTINNISAQPGDIVGAFVNGECRGREEVIMNNDTAYVTMLIQGESVENVSFQIWQGSSKKELLVPKQISSDPGGTISFININAVSGLVAFFPFNNNLIDETKNGFDIFGDGLKFVQDRFNKSNSAVAFDGVTSQAEVINSTNLNFPKYGFTISTWVKFSDNIGTVFFGKHENGYYNGYFIASGSQLQFYVSGTHAISPDLSNDDKWHLVTGVFDGKTAILYIDGVQKAAQPVDYRAMSPNPVRLGHMQTPNYNARYKGLIDDTRIYNVPLSQEEVSNLFTENNWTAQTINVLNPNGENRIKANSIYQIDWSAGEYIDSVKIEFTPDDGRTWEVIAPSLPGNSGSFNWRVPKISTMLGRIRISHLTSSVSAVSSVPFYIDLPQVELTSPNGGEFWQVGSTQNISWTSSNFQQVKIDYSTDGGARWNNITTSTPAANGNFNWIVGNDTTSKALVRISDADDSTFFDVSHTTFTIFLPKLDLTSPLGGERYRLGTTQNISWTSEYIYKVKIEFSEDNGSSWTVLPGADSVLASLANYSWQPNVETKQAKIRISNAKNSVFISTSNAFEIFVPKISLTSPNGGEQWRTGTSQKISWTSSDVAKVKIQYTTNDGTNWILVADSALASIGSFDWTVPSPVTNQAKVRITDYKDVTVSAQSAAPFTIYFPTITLASPNGGELWQIGSQKNISWTSTYLTKVKLEYTPDGTTWKLIADQLDANLNNYLWTIPNDPSTNTKVKISDATDNLVSYTSELPFTIYQQKLTLTSPLGGERYRELTEQNVTWSSEYVDTLKIELSLDNGVTWAVINGAVPAKLGSYPYVASTWITKQAKIRISDSKNPSLQSTSNAFEFYKPIITASSPNGGEHWLVGTTQKIIWTSSDVANVKIEYTTDNIIWNTIASSVASVTGSYDWVVPNTPSVNCKVKISDASNNFYSDLSDNVFSIILPKITATSPNGGEQWIVGTTQSIRWTSSDMLNVKIDYSTNNGTNWIPVISSVPAGDGSYVWTIPNTASTNCRVRISDLTNGTYADTSDNVFSIILPQITVLKPNGGENFVVGKTDTIKWSSANVANVKLEYTTDNGSNWSSILASTPATVGSFVWTVPNTPSTNCKVRISDVTNNAFADVSDNLFSIILPQITVLKPNGGENFVVGKTDTIKWSSANVANVKLEYTTDNGSNWISILASTPATAGSFVWTVPNTPSVNCKVRISDVTNNAFADVSDNLFSIILPKITVTAPNGGEQWIVEATQNITWTSSNVASVKLEYTTNNGTNWSSILASTPASIGSYLWTIPNTPSTNCKIRISDVGSIAVPDLSDNVFSIILPKVTVTSPNGSEQWIVGTTQNITWTSSNVASVKLEYTTNNGTNWNSILTSTPAAAGSFVWTIPNTPSANCKVRISDVTNSAFADASDNLFSIILPKLTLFKPNGGEIFPIAKTDTIKWTSSNIADVKLEFTTNNGNSWVSITNSTPATTGSYLWSVPNFASTNCKVRISDVTNSSVADTSDNLFTIILPTITLLKPNGGESFIVGKTDTIKWSSTYVENVEIKYTTDNITWNTITASTPANTGTYLWTIPNTPSTTCQVWVSDVAKVATSRISANYFSIVLPKITVLKPNGGESFVVGKTDTIKWTSSNVANVKLEYTTDSGSNWISILASTPAAVGSFVWSIPNTPSANCLVRVSDVANVSVPDVSDNVFSIILPKITLLKPNGGENFIVGKTDTIKWSSSNVANVKIEYHIDKANWITIHASTPAAAGSFIWTIPNTPSTNCEVRISDAANNALADTSANPFSIILPKVTVVRPNGGERFIVGKVDTIKWASSDIAEVKVEYSTDNGTNWMVINSSVPASVLSLPWTIPNTPSANCIVKVSDVLNSEITDLSDGTFAILAPTVTLTSPNGGEQWQGGTEQTISWSQKDVTRLKIEYTLDDNSWISIPDTIDASVGNYKWLVPETETNKARVRLTETIDTLVRDMSDEVFTIFIPKLTVTKPNGGETFVAGKTDTIKWTSSSIENVKIDFSADNGLNWNTIIASTSASTGNFVWTIPNSPSKNCKIKISDVLNAELTDQNDLPFNIIAPTITLLSPNGGEKWLAQTSHEISWTSSDIDSVRIDFSFDNGTTWNVIAPKVFAWDAIYNWNVESLPTSQALVRVSKYNDLSVQDVSDNVYTIYKEALAVTSPNGGEKLRAKTIVPITWNISEIVNPKARKKNLGDAQDVATAPIQNIKIEFTLDNGLNWNTIAASVNAELKSYNWEIPAIESKSCLVRITDIGDATHSDTSDNVFEIYSPKVIVTSPNGGEKWRTSTTQKLSWISSEINKVKIEYSTNDGFAWKIISDSVDASAETFDWKIPAERTSRARVRITDVSLASTADTSDNTFTIVVPEITLTSPAGGENWKTNTVQQIKWNSLDVELVSIEFSSDDGTSWLPIKDSVLASSGLYNWTIPKSPTEQAKIRVSDVNYKEISAVSNLFSIIKPLALLVPQGGEKWFSGSTQQIKWNFNFVDSVKLEYSLNNGASWLLIANSLPAALLVYDWNIPQNISSTQCRVKITDRNNILTADSSLEVFTIMTPTLTVLTPNGGENLKGGTVYQLTWKNQNSDSLVIDYTIDDGTTWANIIKSTSAKTEKLTWTVPKVTSTQCRIRIIDKFYTTVGDTSDRVFSIYTPEITVVTPKGGETWYVGETKQIKWKSSFIESVKIVLTTDDGNSWRILTNSISAADSVFSLFIEKTPSTNCRIKIWATEDSTVLDSSRSNFAIAILPPTIHVSILQNPVLTQYCNVVLVSDSLLSALPTTDVWRTGDNEIPVYEMNPIQNSTNVFECSVKFDTTGIYNFHSRVISKMGIEKDTLRQFAVGVALPNLFAKVTSRNEGLSLAINPGVVDEKTFFSIEEEKTNKEIIYNLQPAKTFKKAIGVELSFANETFEEVYKFSVFVLENGEWKPVPSEVNKKTKTVTASLTTLGKVKLGIDANKKEVIDLPKTFALIQNYPNPFNPSTVITYHLPEDCEFTLEIYNMLGARILTLYSGFAVAGRYSVTWNGMNDANVQVPSGIYLYRLKTNKFDQVRKMILLK